jgi:hypothetical protein
MGWFTVDPEDRDGPTDPAATSTIPDSQWASLRRRQQIPADDDEAAQQWLRTAAQNRNRRWS